MGLEVGSLRRLALCLFFSPSFLGRPLRQLAAGSTVIILAHHDLGTCATKQSFVLSEYGLGWIQYYFAWLEDFDG